VTCGGLIKLHLHVVLIIFLLLDKREAPRALLNFITLVEKQYERHV
jgi:hypothetical protein